MYTDDTIQKKLNMPGKGKFPREEGFLGGSILQRKWDSECFWGSVLNKFALLTRDEFQKVTLGATYVSTKCKFCYIICSKSNVGGGGMIIHARLTVVCIYNRYPPRDFNGTMYIQTIRK